MDRSTSSTETNGLESHRNRPARKPRPLAIARFGNVRVRVWGNKVDGELHPRIDFAAYRGRDGEMSFSFTPDELRDVARAAMQAEQMLRKHRRWHRFKEFVMWFF